LHISRHAELKRFFMLFFAFFEAFLFQFSFSLAFLQPATLLYFLDSFRVSFMLSRITPLIALLLLSPEPPPTPPTLRFFDSVLPPPAIFRY
jgi:hypothetical protein